MHLKMTLNYIYKLQKMMALFYLYFDLFFIQKITNNHITLNVNLSHFRIQIFVNRRRKFHPKKWLFFALFNAEKYIKFQQEI
jgi:hypothetical protein